MPVLAVVRTIAPILVLGLAVAALLLPGRVERTAYHSDDGGFLWVSLPASIEQLYVEADAIALVQITGPQAVRVIQSGPRIAGALFTDTRATVLRTYKGRLPASITLMQTGGQFGSLREDNVEDPILVPGLTTLLFLVDISSDPIQSQGQQKFRSIAPSARFDLIGGRITTHTSEATVARDFNGASLAQLEEAIATRGGR
jgi:hypothetical protein